MSDAILAALILGISSITVGMLNLIATIGRGIMSHKEHKETQSILQENTEDTRQIKKALNGSVKDE